MVIMKSLSLSAALILLATMSSAVVTEESDCRIMKGLALCPSIQYLTKVPSTSVAEKRIQEYFDKMPSLSLQTSCLTALQDALCLLEFPKCASQTQETLPVCWSVRDRVAQLCYEPFNHEHPPSGPTSDQHVEGDEGVTLEQIRDSLFTPSFDTRWAASASVQEPDCVSFSDRGIGASPLENIQIVNDLGDQPFDEFKADRLEEEQWLKEQSAADLNADQSGLFEYDDDDVEYYAAIESMNDKLLDRRSRIRQHHHHKSSEGKKHKEKRSYDTSAAKANAKERVHIMIRADESDQAVYTVPMDSGSKKVLAQQSLSHAETNKNSALDDHQHVLAQSGTYNASPSDASDALGKANAGHPVDTIKEAGESDEASHPKKGTVLLAAVPILLLMGAIAGFTVYRRYYENSFNQGGRNDTHDAIPGEDYHRRGSPIHFDRTFLNTIHSPPPTATYLHDPENNSRHQSPTSIASAGNMKRPPPSAGSHGKTRFQELSRSYDFGAGLRSIKNALSRSNNNSRDTLNKANSASISSSSLNGKNHAFGAGGHSLAKIGSHPGLNALERQQLQQQYGASGGPSGSGSGSRFPDIHNMVAQEHSIVWGQYSADDDGGYHDSSATLASNLARKSVSTNSLSGGKYSHHHQQSSAHQPDTPTDSIGDCLSPESPSMSREELMRRREMFAPAYTFGSEGSAATDSHSGTDLLFDARDHFFDMGNEKALETQLHDEEMDMYLSMEKEESPYVVDDYNSMNPAPYEPKVLYRHVLDSNIQKSAPMSEKEPVVRPSISIDRAVEETFDEKAAMKALEDVEEEEEESTHVLGNASPEWNQTIGAEQEQAVDRLSANAAIGATAVALGSSMQASGSVEFDPAEWEEDPRSTSTASLVASGGGGSKGGKKKNKSKKGRKH